VKPYIQKTSSRIIVKLDDVIMARMRKVLANVIRHYRRSPADTRGWDDELRQCQYTTESGRYCAVGLHLRELHKTHEWPHNDSSLEDISGMFKYADRVFSSPTLDEYLEPEWGGIPVGFWGDVQSFHDADENWLTGQMLKADGVMDIGISKDGMNNIKRIKDEWNL